MTTENVPTLGGSALFHLTTPGSLARFDPGPADKAGLKLITNRIALPDRFLILRAF
jgi:hypothetical protein